MKAYNIVVVVAVVCGFVNLVESSVVSDLEKHMREVGATTVNAIEVALKALEDGKVGGLLERTGPIISTLKSINALYCHGPILKESGIDSLRKQLTPSGLLAVAIENTLNIRLEGCVRFWKRRDDYGGLSNSKKIEPVVEEIAENSGVCSGVDATQPLWQYECMGHLSNFDSKKLSKGTLIALNRIDKTKVENILKKKEKETDYVGRVRDEFNQAIFELLGSGCESYKRVAFFEDKYSFNAIYNFLTLNKVAKRNHLESAELNEVKKAVGTAHLCEFLNDDPTIVIMSMRRRRLANAVADRAMKN